MSHILTTLQAPSYSDPDRDSLQTLIGRINEQKGSFRNVSEASLEEEIRNEGQEDALELEDEVKEEVVEQGEDEKTKKEGLGKTRDQMFTQIRYVSSPVRRLTLTTPVKLNSKVKWLSTLSPSSYRLAHLAQLR